MKRHPYSHRPDDYRCPFCDIAVGIDEENRLSIVSDIVYQDDTVTALVASHQYPRNTPNVLIVPNAHYENIFDLPPELGADIYRVAQQIAFALKQAYACAGISTRQHNEPGGSQDVWHYHLHITPRFHGDRFYNSIYNKVLMASEDRALHALRVKSALQAVGKEKPIGGRANHAES